MNPKIQTLQSYPFQKLSALKQGISASNNLTHISLSIGEPKHDAPSFVLDELKNNLGSITHYPLTGGTEALRKAIASWLQRRYQLAEHQIDSKTQVIPVNGTREALFAFAQAVVNPQITHPLVMMPNPFYQIYEGAALLAGATPYFINSHKENNFLLDTSAVDDSTWRDCQLIYVCSPGNPTGAIADEKSLIRLIELADKYDFIIASDECYSEIYTDETKPPIGLLEVCKNIGRNNFERCVVFNSLSKRSNLAGLRSGFVAGDKSILEKFLHYRTYHGCAMPEFSQRASIAAWNDEQHVINNRKLYREKFAVVSDILSDSLPVKIPEASFFLWLETPEEDTVFAQKLYQQQNITVLPGSFLARETPAGNPGKGFVRVALVPPLSDCIEAANRIRTFVSLLKNESHNGI